MNYYKYKVENLITISEIITVHYFEFDDGFISQKEAHDFCEMVYVDKGEISVISFDQPTTLREGEAIIHAPNAPHQIAVNRGTSANIFIVSFDMNATFSEFFKDKVIQIDSENVKLIYRIIREAKNTFDIPFSDPSTKKMPLRLTAPLGGLQVIKNCLEILLIDVLRKEKEQNLKNKAFLESITNDELVKSVIQTLNENVDKRLTIDEIVEKSNYSKSHVFKVFKEQTHTSIISYFNGLKIERAKQLLTQTNFTISQIADMLSYESPNYFIKCFKKATDYTPLQFKKIYLNTKPRKRK